MSDTPVEIEIVQSLSQIAAEDWDACACPEANEGGAPFDCQYEVGFYPTGAQVNKGVKYVANLYLF